MRRIPSHDLAAAGAMSATGADLLHAPRSPASSWLRKPQPTKAIDLYRLGMIAGFAMFCWLPLGALAITIFA